MDPTFKVLTGISFGNQYITSSVKSTLLFQPTETRGVLNNIIVIYFLRLESYDRKRSYISNK